MGEKLQETVFEHADTVVPLRDATTTHTLKPKHIAPKWQQNRKQPQSRSNNLGMQASTDSHVFERRRPIYESRRNIC